VALGLGVRSEIRPRDRRPKTLRGKNLINANMLSCHHHLRRGRGHGRGPAHTAYTYNTTRQPGAEYFCSCQRTGASKRGRQWGPRPLLRPRRHRQKLRCSVHFPRAQAAPVRPPGTGWPNQSGCVFHGRRREAPRRACLGFPGIAHGSRPCVPLHSTDEPPARAAVAQPGVFILLVFTTCPNAKIVMQGCGPSPASM
jgi:hypothetical protein